MVVLVVACAPQPVDRAVLTVDAGADASPTDVRLGEDTAAQADRPPGDQALRDAGADATPADARGEEDVLADDVDAAPDQAVARDVLLVVGDSDFPEPGDARLQAMLAVYGFTVRLASDEDAVALAGVDLVVLSESAVSVVLSDRYRTVAVPVVTLERAAFSEMGMTGDSNWVDHGVTTATQLTIQMQGHPMAAGLTGTVTVVNEAASMGWGSPPAGAERVATLAGLPDRVAIFGYPRGAAMVVGTAAARRVGCFVANDAALKLNDNGLRLLLAAIDWALQ